MYKHVKRAIKIPNMSVRLNALSNKGVDVEHLPLADLLAEMREGLQSYFEEGTPTYNAINGECVEARKQARKEVAQYKRLIPIFEQELADLNEQGKDTVIPTEEAEQEATSQAIEPIKFNLAELQKESEAIIKSEALPVPVEEPTEEPVKEEKTIRSLEGVTKALTDSMHYLEDSADVLRDDLNLYLDSSMNNRGNLMETERALNKQLILMEMERVLHLANALSNIDKTLEELNRVREIGLMLREMRELKEV